MASLACAGARDMARQGSDRVCFSTIGFGRRWRRPAARRRVAQSAPECPRVTKRAPGVRLRWSIAPRSIPFLREIKNGGTAPGTGAKLREGGWRGRGSGPRLSAVALIKSKRQAAPAVASPMSPARGEAWGCLTFPLTFPRTFPPYVPMARFAGTSMGKNSTPDFCTGCG